MTKIAITIGGEKYIYDKTKCKNVIEVCEDCALKGLCKSFDDDPTLCDYLDIASYEFYNFRRATADDEQDHANTIPDELYDRLQKLGIIPNEVRDMNVGASDYSKHIIQPWAIWQEYQLNPWDADIIKRVLRHKTTDTRKMDYEKIIHICKERIRQIDCENEQPRI
jgi:hypothetical protein